MNTLYSDRRLSRNAGFSRSSVRDVYKRQLKGCYSEKTGKTYDAVVLLEDDGQRAGYKLVFDNG